MFINMSNFQPKAGQEAKLKEMFVNQVLPITLGTKGLVSADVVISADGVITNLERWESEAAWKELTHALTARKDLMDELQAIVEKFWEYPVTLLKEFKA